MESNVNELAKSRLVFGTLILLLGFASPLFIPLVTNSSLPIEWKTGLSAFMALGIPEIFMVIAVAILGKPGYAFLKSKLAGFIQPLLPPDAVSLIRYRIGLVLFGIPILIGWVLPYIVYFFPSINNFPIWYYIIADVMFFSSFFVLGGDFWDKFSGLFSNNVKVSKN